MHFCWRHYKIVGLSKNTTEKRPKIVQKVESTSGPRLRQFNTMFGGNSLEKSHFPAESFWEQKKKTHTHTHTKLGPDINSKKGNFGTRYWLYSGICMCCRVKSWSFFALIRKKLVNFSVIRNVILPAERRGVIKNKQKFNQTKHIFISWKLVQLCCATCLDQFLTYTWTSF